MTELECFWPHLPKDLVLSDTDIHVWCMEIDLQEEQIQQLKETLSTEEQKRAERFYFEIHRKRFIASHGFLRALLGRYLGMRPWQLQFSHGHWGKPALAPPCTGETLCFNMSHSDRLALYAVTRKRSVGIDLEYIRALPDAEQLAKNFFSPCEYTAFCSLPSDRKKEAFFRAWTFKEAYLKATGEGLSGLKQIEAQQIKILLSPGESSTFLNIQSRSQVIDNWTVYKLIPSIGYAATLVVEGGG